MKHDWKGNVRELENTIARACILSNYSLIKLSHLADMDSLKITTCPFLVLYL
jgi:DNA-binding NtrC family response regulator